MRVEQLTTDNMSRLENLLGRHDDLPKLKWEDSPSPKTDDQRGGRMPTHVLVAVDLVRRQASVSLSDIQSVHGDTDRLLDALRQPAVAIEPSWSEQRPLHLIAVNRTRGRCEWIYDPDREVFEPYPQAYFQHEPDGEAWHTLAALGETAYSVATTGEPPPRTGNDADECWSRESLPLSVEDGGDELLLRLERWRVSRYVVMQFNEEAEQFFIVGGVDEAMPAAVQSCAPSDVAVVLIHNPWHPHTPPSRGGRAAYTYKNGKLVAHAHRRRTLPAASSSVAREESVTRFS